MDIALRNALSAKKRLKTEITERQEQLRKVEGFIALYSEFAEGVTGTVIPDDSDIGDAPAGKRLTIPDAVAAILRDGYPRETSVLLNMLESQGITVGGNKKIINLSSSLSRDRRRFQNVRGKGWRLVDAPKPDSPSVVSATEGAD